MDITRQYIKQLFESAKPKFEGKETYYLMPTEISMVSGAKAALDKTEYAKLEPEFQKECKAIEVSTDIGTSFNAIALSVVADLLDDAIADYEDRYDSMGESIPNTAIIPISSMSEYLGLIDEELLSEEFPIKAGKLNENDLDVLKSTFDDYQNLGYFVGVCRLNTAKRQRKTATDELKEANKQKLGNLIAQVSPKLPKDMEFNIKDGKPLYLSSGDHDVGIVLSMPSGIGGGHGDWHFYVNTDNDKFYAGFENGDHLVFDSAEEFLNSVLPKLRENPKRYGM